jgi:opacity protein-like surface antigen
MKALVLINLILLAGVPTDAQDTPKAEVFGGYAYAGSGSNGFVASVAGNINDWFGVVGEVGGQYSRLTDQGFTEKIQTHAFMAGPRFSFRRKVTPFAHALFGVSKLKTETTEFGPPLTFRDNGFSMALGGGLDLRVSNAVAIRLVQIDYLRTNFFDDWQNKGRISTGLVLRFGRK